VTRSPACGCTGWAVSSPSARRQGCCQCNRGVLELPTLSNCNRRLSGFDPSQGVPLRLRLRA
jgi:hypothetical protein